MAKRKKSNQARRTPREVRRFRVRGVRRDPPDMRKLGKAVLGLAMAEAERQAQAEHAARLAEKKTESANEESGSDGDG